jgi:hypothetical protein
MQRGPRVHGNVGDRIRVPTQVRRFGEALIQHAIESLDLSVIAIAGVFVAAGCKPTEMNILTAHGTKACQLDHQPFEFFVALRGAGRRQESARLFRQVDQDSARFEQRDP